MPPAVPPQQSRDASTNLICILSLTITGLVVENEVVVVVAVGVVSICGWCYKDNQIGVAGKTSRQLLHAFLQMAGGVAAASAVPRPSLFGAFVFIFHRL